MSIEPASLPSVRYRRMVERMRDAWIAKNKRTHGWKAAIAEELGITGQYVGYIVTGERAAGLDAVNDAIERIGIASDYFHSVKVGRDPNHADFIGPRETRVVVEQIQGLTDYEAEHGELAERFRDSVIGLARNEGPDAITYDVVERHVGTLRAIDRGKKTSRPRDVENVIDEKAGQTKVTRKPKR